MDAAVTAPKLMQQKAIVMPMARGPNLPATQRKAVLSGIVMRKKYTDTFGDHPTGQL